MKTNYFSSKFWMNQSTKSSNSYMQCDKICSFGASLNWVDYIVSHKPKHNFLTIWCSHLVDLGRYLKSMFRVQVHVVMRRFVQCEHSKIASNVLDLRNFVSISVAVHFNRRFIRMNVLQIKGTHENNCMKTIILLILILSPFSFDLV